MTRDPVPSLAEILKVYTILFSVVKGDVVIPMPSLNDIKPFTPVRANPIRIPDFLHYVASHQDSMAKYKDEFKVRSLFGST